MHVRGIAGQQYASLSVGGCLSGRIGNRESQVMLWMPKSDP
jgi:hypothetical protein